MPCMCGDSECPSCGQAQGTLTTLESQAGRMAELEELVQEMIDVLQHAQETLEPYVDVVDGDEEGTFVLPNQAMRRVEQIRDVVQKAARLT